MADYNIQNTIAQPSSEGQSVLITVNQNDPDQLFALNVLVDGTECTVQSSGNIGYATQIDMLGGTFKIIPQYPYSNLSSNVPSNGGVIQAGETILFSI